MPSCWRLPTADFLRHLELGQGRYLRHADGAVFLRRPSPQSPTRLGHFADSAELVGLAQAHTLRMGGYCVASTLALTSLAAEVVERHVHRPDVQAEHDRLAAELEAVEELLAGRSAARVEQPRLAAELAESRRDLQQLAAVSGCGVNVSFAGCYAAGANLLLCRVRPETPRSLGLLGIGVLAAAAGVSTAAAGLCAGGRWPVEPWMFQPPPPFIHFV